MLFAGAGILMEHRSMTQCTDNKKKKKQDSGGEKKAEEGKSKLERKILGGWTKDR